MSKINLPIRKKELYLSNRKFNDNGDILEKKCSICSVFKSIKEFDINKLQFDGTLPHCIECHRDKMKESYKKKKHKKNLEIYGDGYVIGMENKYGTANINHKVCRDCEIEKPVNEFYKMKTLKDGISSYCKKCQYIRSEGYKKNIDGEE